jgi:hypothetical protein
MRGSPHDEGDHAAVAQRRARALQLKVTGMTWQQVADAMHEHYHGSPAHAHMDVKRAREEAQAQIKDGLEDLIALSDARLDDMRRRVYAVLAQFHPLVANGKMVVDQDGNPVRDPKPYLDAVEKLGKIENQWQDLHGIKASPRLELLIGQRTEAESTLVVEAILAGFEAADLPPEKRLRALEAAQAKLAAADESSGG